MTSDGILSGPIDLDGPRRPSVTHPSVAAQVGLVVEHRATGVVGSIRSFNEQVVVLRDRHDVDRPLRVQPGGFLVEGQPATLVAPASEVRPAPRTASGSISSGPGPARVARASRILVEGIHDAELVEKVWGDDLRIEGIVVELLDGADHLREVVASFGPRPGRRLGVLLDHLVDDSKESRLAAGVGHPDVLVAGHPYVDVWAAVKPATIGLDKWPDIPRGRSWKDGVMEAVGPRLGPGAEADARRFWTLLLGSVSSWTDLEAPLVGAVESLIDFVTEPVSA